MIGFIGLGNMGSAMVQHLLNAQHEVVAWARSPESLAAWSGTPIRTADSIAALCNASNLICLNVTHTDDVESLLFRPNGIAEHAQPDTLVIDFSTIDAGRVKAFVPKLTQKQIHYLDCPVSGGVAAAKTASLTMMAGGPQPAFDRALPILKVLGKTIRHVGPNGAGQAIKAANQMAMCIQLVGIAEAMNYALEQGADLGIALEVMQAGLAGSKVLDWAGPHMVQGFTEPVSIEAHLHAKDVRMVADAAQQQGLHLPLLFQTADTLDKLIARGPKSQDTSRVFEVVRQHLKQA